MPNSSARSITSSRKSGKINRIKSKISDGIHDVLSLRKKRLFMNSTSSISPTPASPPPPSSTGKTVPSYLSSIMDPNCPKLEGKFLASTSIPKQSSSTPQLFDLDSIIDNTSVELFKIGHTLIHSLCQIPEGPDHRSKVKALEHKNTMLEWVFTEALNSACAVFQSKTYTLLEKIWNHETLIYNHISASLYLKLDPTDQTAVVIPVAGSITYMARELETDEAILTTEPFPRSLGTYNLGEGVCDIPLQGEEEFGEMERCFDECVKRCGLSIMTL